MWVDKLESAKIQLRSAIRLHFEECKPLSAHTDAMGSHTPTRRQSASNSSRRLGIQPHLCLLRASGGGKYSISSCPNSGEWTCQLWVVKLARRQGHGCVSFPGGCYAPQPVRILLALLLQPILIWCKVLLTSTGHRDPLARKSPSH